MMPDPTTSSRRPAPALAGVLLALLLAAGPVLAQGDPPATRRFDLPEGPIVRQVPPIDHIERPHRAAPDGPEDPLEKEKSEWEALWERNATPDADEVERFRKRRREMDANGPNQTRHRAWERGPGSSGGYYREPFPENDQGVIRRRTYVPQLKDGTLYRVPMDTYEPSP